jgi:ribonuclease HII
MFKKIRKLYKQGYKCVIGLDEAGRGPLAGPVVAAAVFAAAKLKGKSEKGKIAIKNAKLFVDIKDSKKLSAKQREEWYGILAASPDIEWGIGIVLEKIIDKINILEATKLAMAKAVRDLEKKIGEPAEFLIIDGNFVLSQSEVCPRTSPRTDLGLLEQKAIIKADEKIFVCIAAGIIAKVTRDRMMRRLHKKYPQYGFDKHKGYGTKGHLRALRKYGPCEAHRMTFNPIATFLAAKKLRKKLPPGDKIQTKYGLPR